MIEDCLKIKIPILETDSGENLGYNLQDREGRALRAMKDYLSANGEHIISGEETVWRQHQSITTFFDVYRFRDATVVLEGIHELEIDNRFHYREISFKVAGSSEDVEREVLSQLEAKVREIEQQIRAAA